MWLVLSGLVVLIWWALWFALDLPTIVPVLGTVVVVLALGGLYAYRFWKARQASSALEKAIAQQGAQQALSAKPERRAEIQELQKQVLGGIDALKKSKLAGKKKQGGSALYSLPWYVIIGPPGAGKTTALKHSGLVFPFADPRGGGVRGVGGTRNCDWWFTNEAILLDTAGRYATEQHDHDEWISFLQMLKRYRSKKPINGVIVAVSITDVIDANEVQIEAMGKKLRARIDEVMNQLQMIVPVYMLFTKCDLVAGFIEFFGDLRKSDRQQVWGATLRLDINKNDVVRLFDGEFETLCKHVHTRALKRLVSERNREAREKIYQFPLEFAGIKRNVLDLIQTIFAVNSFQGTPLFRGFYFTSGTQEGRPLDRVLQRMSQAMGVRPAELQAQQVVESKSYFLYDMFMKVVFPDAGVAARSEYEIRRQKMMRIAVGAAALSLGLIAAIPGVRSFVNNRTFLRETEERARVVSTLNWRDGQPPSAKIDTLRPLLDRLKEIDTFREDGPPSGMGWGMYHVDRAYNAAVAVYVYNLQTGFVQDAKTRLEAQLKGVKGDAYLRERLWLKTYLMLNDIEHLDVKWATGRYTNLWADMLKGVSDLPEIELKNRLAPHVEYYFTLLKNKKVAPLPMEQSIVDSARKTLAAVPVPKRYYDMFVNVLIDELYDEAGGNTRSNKKYPAINLQEMFPDRPNILKYISSKRYQKEKKWQEVEGPYNEKGHWQVVDNITDAAGLLEREQWVVPLSPEERPDRIPANIARLAQDYETQYINQWNDFMEDLQVTPPANVKQAIELYGALRQTEYAYLRVLRTVDDNTQWKREGAALDNKELNQVINRKLNLAASSRTQGIRFNLDVGKLSNNLSNIPSAFKRTVEFAKQPPRAASDGPIVTETSLVKYVVILEKLQAEMQKAVDLQPDVDGRQFSQQLIDATKEVASLLAPYDDKTRALLMPLLIPPLQVVAAKLPPPDSITKFAGKQTPRFSPLNR